MRILIMGGTRFIGVSLTKILVAQGHEVVLFNRGNKPAPVNGIEQIHGDRTNASELKDKLAGQKFDAIFDNNGRELKDTKPLVELFKDQISHFVYVSSAGVYLPSEQMPHREDDPVDPQSRHKGKYETETYLKAEDVPFTSIRPTYIYGSGNYNDLEAWFFDRILRNQPILIPYHGLHFTQFGHVEDLATAMSLVLGNSQAVGQIYNISGDRYVTFKGLALACAEAVGKNPEEIEIKYYDPAQFNLGKRKAFPIRVQHFFADISKAQKELNWQPKYDLISGLKESFENDYLANGRDKVDVDFSLDQEILNN
ncbi:NAD-dependent epimerase/dehydratase family protein [Cyanobacterium aponinum UTEX 3222]|uniref:NAD-dependent epimerase/dehydratase family protein n=1 Tax=Cyanobacterium aponinum TaxID=379064 RepID=UPI002B4BB80D|nr:NAD-dependent epimerase/dehydratase family protein [Cyanobacterium aponinum]WRL39497.1 NAD-dependent epimerase/dehydratase family protein [Cyanobacterium aponinum UTEX 3221]WRL42276.1 NAD-dependent epimerase/dehydratase family protein [Cyanobacterium aponinum UTEX 3222]